MATINFKGKEFVRHHHLSVPYRPLEPNVRKSVGQGQLDSNLIIHGDNLHALKSLLPMYAGKVDCCYADPPYNTGNEGWCYNDNVSSPQLQAWISQNPIGTDDTLRHDKWCAMMWPRLKLIRDLLADSGAIFISIDHNELHRLSLMMDEIFGEINYLGVISVVNNKKGRSDDKYVATANDFILVYAKDKEKFSMNGKSLTEEQMDEYKLEDEEGRYKEILLRKTGKNKLRQDRENQWYPVYYHPKKDKISLERMAGSVEIYPLDAEGQQGNWRWGKKKFLLDIDNIVVRKVNGGNNAKIGEYRVFTKMRMESGSQIRTRLPKSVWLGTCYDTAKGDALLEKILPDSAIENVKPLDTVRDVLIYGSNKNSVILDPFAGSGTTGHAVLDLNKTEGSNRKFILIEGESYADNLAAERIRRIIKGVPHSDDESLRERLGGEFTYCTLAEKIDVDAMLTGEKLPTFKQLGKLLFMTATGGNIDVTKMSEKKRYLGESAQYHVWLIYEHNLAFLKGAESALTMPFVEKICAEKKGKKRHLVFAPATFVSSDTLAAGNKGKGIPVDYQPLPWSLYRIRKE